MSSSKRFWGFVSAILAAGGIAAVASRRRARPDKRRNRSDEFTRVDQAGLESFPASDPPSWTLGEDREA